MPSRFREPREPFNCAAYAAHTSTISKRESGSTKLEDPAYVETSSLFDSGSLSAEQRGTSHGRHLRPGGGRNRRHGLRRGHHGEEPGNRRYPRDQNRLLRKLRGSLVASGT